MTGAVGAADDGFTCCGTDLWRAPSGRDGGGRGLCNRTAKGVRNGNGLCNGGCRVRWPLRSPPPLPLPTSEWRANPVAAAAVTMSPADRTPRPVISRDGRPGPLGTVRNSLVVTIRVRHGVVAVAEH